MRSLVLAITMTITMICLSAMLLSAGTLERDRVLIEKLVSDYVLDTLWYEVAVDFCNLKSDDIAADYLQLRALTRGEPLGTFSVTATVTDGVRVLESGRVRFAIRRFAEVLVLADRVGRAELLNESHVRTARMDVTNLRERPVVSFEEIDGYRARRNLTRGSIVTTGDVEPVPDVESGREVTIVYNDGRCQISTPGIAMGTGSAGDYIKVRNSTSGKVLVARVVDGTAVAIDP
jgi:flagella basal body P-ring formation protein FlgA